MLIGAGIPHMVVNRFIKKRNALFTAKFPDAIELLVVRGQPSLSPDRTAKDPYTDKPPVWG